MNISMNVQKRKQPEMSTKCSLIIKKVRKSQLPSESNNKKKLFCFECILNHVCVFFPFKIVWRQIKRKLFLRDGFSFFRFKWEAFWARALFKNTFKAKRNFVSWQRGGKCIALAKATLLGPAPSIHVFALKKVSEVCFHLNLARYNLSFFDEMM